MIKVDEVLGFYNEPLSMSLYHADLGWLQVLSWLRTVGYKASKVSANNTVPCWTYMYENILGPGLNSLRLATHSTYHISYQTPS